MLMRRLVIARDSKNGNTPVAGLTPTWVHLTDLEQNERFDADELPKFRELCPGQYVFTLDAKPGRHYFGQVDLGPALADGFDRYVDFDFGFTEGE